MLSLNYLIFVHGWRNTSVIIVVNFFNEVMYAMQNKLSFI